MKKLIIGSAVLFLLQSCSSTDSTINPIANNNNVSSQSASKVLTADHHPDFARKLKEGKNYKVNTNVKGNDFSDSLCGASDLQHVNDYDGTLDATKAFVKEHQGAVGAMATGKGANSRKFCSGAMISENLFLTASHCLGSGVSNTYVAMNFEKAAGSNRNLQQEDFKVLEIVEDGGYRQAGGMDYAVLRLEGTPGKKYGYSKIKIYDVKDGANLRITQHPRGQVKQFEAGPKQGNRGVYIGYADLDTHPGSSGSRVQDADGYTVAVHTNGGCSSSGGGTNKGVAISEIAKISKVIPKLAVK